MLKRDISSTSLLMIAAGSMVGSGWLFSPLISAQMAGPDALISWTIAAVFMIFIALPLCEVGSMLPISGGMANYPLLTHGKTVGFLFALTAWLSYVVVSPIEARAVLQYVSHFFPELIKADSKTFELSGVGYATAFILLLAITLLNNFGVKLLAECSKYAGIIKFFVPFLAVFCLLETADSMQAHIVLSLSQGQDWVNIFSALSTGGIAFAFLGFQTALMLAGEVEKPQRDIPVAVLGSIFVAFALYFSLQWGFIAAMPDKYIAHGWENIHFPGMASPLVGLTLLLGFSITASLILIDSSFSPLGTALVYTTGTTRILYSMAVNKHLPPVLLKLNRYKIPYVALFFNFAISMFSFLPFPSWQKMVAFLSSTGILSYAVGALCLPALRKLIPEYKRPFRLGGANVFCYIAFCICSLMLHWCGFPVIWKLCVALLIGLIVHIIYQKKWDFMKDKSLLWFITYMGTLFVISYLGPFEGTHTLEFPKDIFLLIFLSIILFYFSQKCITDDTHVLEKIKIMEEDISSISKLSRQN